MNLWNIGKALIEGVAQIPQDLYYAGRRAAEDSGFLGEQAQRNNAEEYDRVGNVIMSALKNRKVIADVIEIIVLDFMDKLPADVENKLQERLALTGVKFVSKQGARLVLATAIVDIILVNVFTSIIAKRAAKLGIGLVLSAALLYGMVERASNASLRLKRINPRLHNKLVTAKLDMLYFLVEEPLAPFVVMDATRLHDPAAFEKFSQDLLEVLK